MSITVTPATTQGRVIVKSDGCSSYYSGALVQGAPVARISAPATVVARYTDADGVDLQRLLRDLRGDRKWHGLSKVRVLELRYVE